VGALEGIGQRTPTLRADGVNPDDHDSHSVNAPDYTSAADVLLNWFEKRHSSLALAAVGHRLVHGGPKYAEPQRITAKMLAELQTLSLLAPQHLPEEISLVKAFLERFSNVPQVACFDTAFHHELPRVARLLPIPRRFEAQGVRRYGFHGLSYTFLMQELARLDGRTSAKGRVILAHLGNGASLAAVHKGRPIDTSMSFTPTGGVPMGTRSGDLDPGLLGYLARVEDLSAAQLNEIVTSRSGLLGMSETSSDMRELLQREDQDERAAEAVAVFCYQIKKWIGAFAAALDGLDTLVFTGGIGENAPVVRQRICAGLAFLGIELDETQNAANAAVVSAPAGRVLVRVMKTDEERTIAEMACELLGISRPSQAKP
jgi:acetate kinase